MTDAAIGTTPDDLSPSDTAEPSIVDTILDLDALLSADVRRAEKTARFCTEPWREARIDELNAELDSLTDDNGMPLDSAVDQAVGETGRTALTVAMELRDEQRAYAAAFRSVRMQQLPSSGEGSFSEYKKKWDAAISAGPEYPLEMVRELVTGCAVAPKISPAQFDSLVQKFGEPQVQELWITAWQVCANSGVSVPKSPLSSAVLRRARLSKS